MAKEEIANREQFLLLQQCFQKKSALEASESICMRERVKEISGYEKYFPMDVINYLGNTSMKRHHIYYITSTIIE